MAHARTPCVSAMCMSSDSILAVTRTTTCDVMCTTTSSLAITAPNHPSSIRREKADATLPYKNDMPAKLPKGNTSFTLFKNIEIKNARSNEMKKERDAFFVKIEADRQEKMERELAAAIKIQAFARGILVRPWPEETRVSKKPPIIRIGVINSDVVQKLQDELCSYSVQLGLKPISGLSLENRNKQNKRRKRIELAAALRLQSYFRMIKCIIQTHRKLSSARSTMRQRAALVLTKFFRWVLRVAQQSKMQNAHRNLSVVKIQTNFRMFKSFHRVKKLMAERAYAQRTNDAQIIIRRNLFDKIQRQKNNDRRIM